MDKKQQINPDLLKENDYVNLHGHSHYSIGDALGSASEIMKSVIDNGMNAVAITDHGNLNVVADAYNHVMREKNSGYMDPNFKYIMGCEFYFHPDLNEWKNDVRIATERDEAIKAAKKKKTQPKDQVEEIIPEEDIEDELISAVVKSKEDDDDKSGIENEEESKKFDIEPAKRRHHLVLLAQNETGLNNLFKLNAFAQTEGIGSYGRQQKMPRIDFNQIKKNSEGLICTSACLAGDFSYLMNRGFNEGLSEDKILLSMENEVQRFDEIFNQGIDKRFYLEIQFNKVNDHGIFIQHKLNEFLVKLSRKTGIPLVAAADYHYPQKNLFKARDLIKANSQKGNVKIHTSLEDLTCNLFPKNAKQMIEEYNEMDGGDYITQDELLTAIRNSSYIANDLISNYRIDTAPKFPDMGFNPKKMLAQWLAKEIKLLFEKEKFPIEKQREYIDRVKLELNIIDDKMFHAYFTTYKVIVEELKKQMLTSPGRGSGAGSLINYLLGITEVDPIKYGLRFDRFMDPYRVEIVPDMLFI
jgi:DNA polymerase III alpha subunit